MSLLGGIKLAAAAGNPYGALFKLLWKPVLVLIVLLAAVWWIYGKGYASCAANKAAEISVLQANLSAANTRADQALHANASLAASEQLLRQALKEATDQNTQLASEGQARVDEAKAEKAKAEKDARDWRHRYQEIASRPACKQALINMAAACPVGSY